MRPIDSPVDPLVVRRSTVRTWLAALAGIPAIVLGVDVLFRQRIVGWVSDRVFADSDPQLLEPRDTIWAWALVVVGGIVVAWGLKELFSPAPVLRTDGEGVHIRMSGPFRAPTTIPWSALYDVDAGTLEDDDEALEVLVVEVNDPGVLPLDPWAGRRFDERTLALYATEWDTPADEVATRVADQAVRMAQLASPEPSGSDDAPIT